MLAKGYHIKRLPFKIEKEIREVLRNGSDAIVKVLHEHFKDYSPGDSEDVFEEALKIVGTTIANVASHAALHYKDADMRISYLPGYTTKSSKRITIKTEWDNKLIPTDIAFKINKEKEVKRVVDTTTNQALLYYFLLMDYDGDINEGFINGGTHRFLIENAPLLETQHNYHLDVLQIYTGIKKTNPKDEVTFLNIPIDFQKQNSVGKLYKYFDGVLNKNISEKKWPCNSKDDTLPKETKDNIYKMRGHLISLWFKILHDNDKTNIDSWINQCIKLADHLKFVSLQKRLLNLQNCIDKNSDESYRFWYSLAFNPLPDFSSPGSVVKETIGNAMILTSFEVKPAFFFWIQPWINRMYRHLRDFENLENINQETYNEIKRNIKKKNKFYPEEVAGQRWLKGDVSQKHKLPLLKYYEDYFSLDNSSNHDTPFINGKNILNCITLIKWLESFAETENSDSIDYLKRRLLLDFGKYMGKKELGSLLDDFDSNKQRANRLMFSDRLTGRFVCIGAYLYLNFSMQLIHSILIAKQFNPDIAGVKSETPYRMLRSNFFVSGMGKDDTDEGRIMCFSKVCNGISDAEREHLTKWYRDLNSFIDSICDNNTLLKDYFNQQFRRILPPKFS